MAAKNSAHKISAAPALPDSGTSDDRPVLSPGRIKQRKDFLAARNGARSHGRAFVLQGRKRPNGNGENCRSGETRFGFTVTKKIGNAVARNRARRRLREAVKKVEPDLPDRLSGHDVVVIAKKEALTLPFDEMVDALKRALHQIVANDGAKGQKRRDHSGRKNSTPTHNT